MNKIIASSAFVLMFGFSSVSLAAGPTWNSMSASWVVSGDLESGSISYDLEGFQFSGTKSLDDMFFVRAAANNIGVKVSGTVTDVSTQQIGVGARYGVVPGVDLWGAINYDRMNFAGIVGTGLGLDVGARWQAMQELELGLTYKYSKNLDFDVADGELTGYELNAVYDVSPKIGVMLTFSKYSVDIKAPVGASFDYKNVIGLGVRLAY